MLENIRGKAVPLFAPDFPDYIPEFINPEFLSVERLGDEPVGSADIGIATGSLSTKFPNLSIAYQKYGYAYCYANSVVNVGVKKPKEYSAETIQKIKQKLDAAEDAPVENADTPNIIFLQLESFFDVNKVKDLELSEEATPIFNQLKKEYPSGFLSVNNVGYGTANTEFEMMTGKGTLLMHF